MKQDLCVPTLHSWELSLYEIGIIELILEYFDKVDYEGGLVSPNLT